MNPKRGGKLLALFAEVIMAVSFVLSKPDLMTTVLYCIFMAYLMYDTILYCRRPCK